MFSRALGMYLGKMMKGPVTQETSLLFVVPGPVRSGPLRCKDLPAPWMVVDGIAFFAADE